MWQVNLVSDAHDMCRNSKLLYNSQNKTSLSRFFNYAFFRFFCRYLWIFYPEYSKLNRLIVLTQKQFSFLWTNSLKIISCQLKIVCYIRFNLVFENEKIISYLTAGEFCVSCSLQHAKKFKAIELFFKIFSTNFKMNLFFFSLTFVLLKHFYVQL